MKTIRETNFAGIAPAARGKVRDIYDLGDRLLIVATDRLSAFDVVMPTPIPDKGRVLTQLSLFWFNLLHDVIPNHVISSTDFPAPFSSFARRPGWTLHGCAKNQTAAHRMRRSRIFVRVRLEGIPRQWESLWHPPAEWLKESDKLPSTIFTPAIKASSGHDENIPFEQAAEMIGKPLAEKVREVTLNIYQRAAAYAEQRGILLADTKFEFGILNDELIWIDEALTPDSSRFWSAAQYKPGGAQPSFDKQFVRDYLERIQWPKTPPGPVLPPDVVAATRAKYREAYRILVGHELD